MLTKLLTTQFMHNQHQLTLICFLGYICIGTGSQMYYEDYNPSQQLTNSICCKDFILNSLLLLKELGINNISNKLTYTVVQFYVI